MIIKVKNTDVNKITALNKKIRVADAMITFLISSEETPIYNDKSREYLKPIVVSFTEEIKVGDLYTDNHGKLQKCKRIDEILLYPESKDRCADVKNCAKVLALPENISKEDYEYIRNLLSDKMKVFLDPIRIKIECVTNFIDALGKSEEEIDTSNHTDDAMNTIIDFYDGRIYHMIKFNDNKQVNLYLHNGN